MSEFVHHIDDDDYDEANAIVIPRIFSENSRTKNAGYQHQPIFL